VSREMEGSWSREQIASGLRLVGSGVPVIEVTEMMASVQRFSLLGRQSTPNYSTDLSADSRSNSAL